MNKDNTSSKRSITLFGEHISTNAVRAMAILGSLCSVLPSEDYWQTPPQQWMHGIARILELALDVSLAISQRVLAVAGIAMLILLMVALYENVIKDDNKCKVAIIIFCCITGIITLVAVGVDNGNQGTEDIDSLFLAVITGLSMLVAMPALLLFIGVRLYKKDMPNLRRLGIALIVYAMAGVVADIYGGTFSEYSIGAKSMSLVSAATDCYLYLSLSSAIIHTNAVDERTQNAICTLFCVYALLFFVFLFHPYGLSKASHKSSDQLPTAQIEENIDILDNDGNNIE